MTCEEFLDLAAAYTLGIVDEAERAACTAHLAEASHRGCLEAVADARDISVKLAVTLPARPPSAALWGAIESRITRSGSHSDSDGVPGSGAIAQLAATAAPASKFPAGARGLRELAGWFVAAVVVGFHLYNVPVDPKRAAVAGQDRRGPLPDSGSEAMSLMTAPGTRLSAFAALREGVGGASIMLNMAERRAVVVARSKRADPPEGLRLWTVRGDQAPTSLGMLSPAPSRTLMQTDDRAELSAANLGAAMFEPALPDRLLISLDTPDASAPQAVLLSASLR
jgi:anti-sigma-K factor RskA